MKCGAWSSVGQQLNYTATAGRLFKIRHGNCCFDRATINMTRFDLCNSQSDEWLKFKLLNIQFTVIADWHKICKNKFEQTLKYSRTNIALTKHVKKIQNKSSKTHKNKILGVLSDIQKTEKFTRFVTMILISCFFNIKSNNFHKICCLTGKNIFFTSSSIKIWYIWIN